MVAFSEPGKPESSDVIHTHKVVGFVWNCDSVSLKEVSNVGATYRSWVKVPLLLIVGFIGCVNAIGYASLKLFMELRKVEEYTFSWLLFNLFIVGLASNLF
jgi:hypothetical protein